MRVIVAVAGPVEWVVENPGPWLIVALTGWFLAALLAVAAIGAGRRRRRNVPGDPPAGEATVRGPASKNPARLPRPADAGVPGVLRWLSDGTEAEAVACLELRPGRGERLRIEPQGLPAATVATLARRGRDALLRSRAAPDPRGVVTLRWLGVGGPRALVALRAASEDAREALRVGRYLIEWVVAAGAEEPRSDLERRVDEVPGVAWAEVDRSSEEVRLVLSEGADQAAARSQVEQALGPEGLRASWIDVPHAVPPEPGEEEPPERFGAPDQTEPRVRLVEVAFSQDGQATADVRVIWKDHELRGRGHAHATPAGPYYAGAKAVADALRPLLDSEVVVEGLYQASTDQAVPVLIAEVLFEGEYLVGAVVDRRGEAHWAGARAVLDAVNRRLVQVAGRSGRI